MYKPTGRWETVQKTDTLTSMTLWAPRLGPKPADLVLHPKPYDIWHCSLQQIPNGSGYSRTYGPHTVWGPEVYQLPLSVSATNAALKKVHEELRIVDSFFEDWYERQQTIDLATKAAKELLFIARNLRKPARLYKRYKGKGKVSTVPETWITYQFAIQPLVGSISRSLDALGAEFPRQKISHSSVRSGTRSGVMLQEMNCYTKYKCTAKVGCVVTGVNPNVGLIGATGLNEPFSSAWAVVPWGWAVDYFVNVGDLISNFENQHPGVKASGWYSSMLFEEELFGRSIHAGSPLYGWLPHAKTAVRGNARMFRRTIGQPEYQLELSFPQLGGKQLANLLSAIALTLKGK